MSTLSVRLPQSLHHELKAAAKREGVSINQLVVTAVARQMERHTLEDFIERHGGPVSREEFLALLAQVPDAPPVPGDELPEDYAERPSFPNEPTSNSTHFKPMDAFGFAPTQRH